MTDKTNETKVLEARMKLAAEIVRKQRPHFAVSYSTQDAIVDRDEVTEDRHDLATKTADAVETSPGGDGFKDSNPDTGAGSVAGNLVIVVNEHTFHEGAFTDVDAFPTGANIAAFIIDVADPTSPAPAEGEAGSDAAG